MTDNSKQAQREAMVAVADDQTAELGLWLKPGAWVAIVCSDPIYYGELVAMTPSHYYLRNASWIPDTGRANEFVSDPASCNESEFLGEIAVERPVVAIYRTKKNGKIDTK